MFGQDLLSEFMNCIFQGKVMWIVKIRSDLDSQEVFLVCSYRAWNHTIYVDLFDTDGEEIHINKAMIEKGFAKETNHTVDNPWNMEATIKLNPHKMVGLPGWNTWTRLCCCVTRCYQYRRALNIACLLLRDKRVTQHLLSCGLQTPNKWSLLRSVPTLS